MSTDKIEPNKRLLNVLDVRLYDSKLSENTEINDTNIFSVEECLEKICCCSHIKSKSLIQKTRVHIIQILNLYDATFLDEKNTYIHYGVCDHCNISMFNMGLLPTAIYIGSYVLVTSTHGVFYFNPRSGKVFLTNLLSSFCNESGLDNYLNSLPVRVDVIGYKTLYQHLPNGSVDILDIRFINKRGDVIRWNKDYDNIGEFK